MVLRPLFIALVAAACAAGPPRSEPAASSPPVSVARDARTKTFTLTAAAARVSLLPGAETDVFAYNGQVPGPTLEVYEGDTVIVRFTNSLPESTTVHWHGLHLPFTMDGSPFHPIAPGGRYDYVFTIAPGAAGTYWYHPHFGHRTGVQVARGLYGAIIVRDHNDPLPPLTEKVLILSDNRFNGDGSVDLAERHSAQGRIDFENGREGNVVFVNGGVMPAIEIRSGEVQRWRIVNASAARVYRLAIPGHRFFHVGGDGGLFERPVEVSELLLANSERAEILVRGTAMPGEAVVVQSLPYDRYIPQTRPRDWNVPRDLFTLRYSSLPPVEPVSLPSVLRRIPALDTLEASATRVVVLTQGFLNGKTMDMARVDLSAPLGATEIWQIENLVGMDHPFHLHGFQFQVIDRDGVPEPFRQWKDTVNVPKHETVRFIVRYADFKGKWMFHCHILDHEDNGMMGILEIT